MKLNFHHHPSPAYGQQQSSVYGHVQAGGAEGYHGMYAYGSAWNHYNDHGGVAFPVSHDDPQQYPVAPGNKMFNHEEFRPSSESRKQHFLGRASLSESDDAAAYEAAMAMSNLDSY